LRSEPSSVSSARRGSTRPTSSESTKEFTRKHNPALKKLCQVNMDFVNDSLI
jgi:hypothetical protein